MSKLTRFFYRLVDARAAKKTLADREYERGYAQACRDLDATGCFCPHHAGQKLYQVGPGIFVCGSCRVEADLPQVVANVERITGPMRPLATTEPAIRVIPARPQVRYNVHVHRALQQGIPMSRAIAEYQDTLHLPSAFEEK